ncbi:hypothetical protein SAMN06265368_0424 [Cohaesibacter gelatinilyticus]|uniref:Uncharacterized protein n=1 Tax=Cohaesibacter gelatinilyticus TaxID=372072 RepID=A0A285NAI3_9HYPH|nr:hypothetical protein SAMN06265368_0424 [Cohaesibacter gelatinilyticus]
MSLWQRSAKVVVAVSVERVHVVVVGGTRLNVKDCLWRLQHGTWQSGNIAPEEYRKGG